FLTDPPSRIPAASAAEGATPRALHEPTVRVYDETPSDHPEKLSMKTLSAWRPHSRSSAVRPRPARARRLLQPRPEALEARALMSLSPHLLNDINQTGVGSFPTNFTAAGDTTFFLADDGVHGQELWVTRRSESSARLVQDINPGAASSHIHG